ncbi:hypothetical protein J4H92_13110 [Leucobacter weissii]|uniref:Uncharacterized protein n=1 Tax=Leucobacter weissii TaxID=1983706 RepID=A0A939MTV9_9MICO|nr:hypothetical protein [Leucobacter weissii]MBO1902884.1 hypothetical protein [Leucobacter weissii]
MTTTLSLSGHASREDLRVYLERLLRAGRAEARLVTRGTVLAVFGCTQAPASLLDRLPVVLVLRSFELAARPDEDVDAVMPARSLLDRIARLGVIGLELELPEVSTTAAWAGVLPPLGGWNPVGRLDAASLEAVAREGMERIAAALPESPGEAVVRTVRERVWGQEIAPGLPAAAAFAAESMGFLGGVPPLRLSRSRSWTRLASERGDVLVRLSMG